MVSNRKRKYKVKDPFAVQPPKKTFYHPSPTKKDVNEKEAIHSPHRKYETPPLKAIEDRFLRNSSTFRTTALPNVQTLSGKVKADTSMPGNDKDTIANGQLDETWPDSEKTSLSISRTASYLTSATEEADAVGGPQSITDIVRGLQRIGKPSPDNKASNLEDVNLTDTGDSILQRYIERFRNCPPKSREERMKEQNTKKQQFWWLNSSHGSNANLSEVEERQQQQNKSKLTKEALKAMDDETLHLQKKADQLLYRSQLSLASSGPIVSTEGLGTSTSITDGSTIEDQPPYRPAFVNIQGYYQRPMPKPLARKEEKSGLEKAVSSPADDILSRWRFRRKMEEAGSARSALHNDKNQNEKPIKQHTEIDSRLKEFRRRIMSQRALVTTEDIKFERQKMAMLIEDDKTDEDNRHEEIPLPSSVPSRDPILDRMQKITGTGEDIYHGIEERTALPLSHSENLNFNNASRENIRVSGLRDGHSMAHPALNRNNTASSDQYSLGNSNVNNVGETEFSVDSFHSQVLCDPKTKVAVLVQKEGSSGASHGAPADVSNDGIRRPCSTEINDNLDSQLLNNEEPKDDTEKKVPEESVVLNVEESSHKSANVRPMIHRERGENVDDENSQEERRKACHSKYADAEITTKENVYHKFLEAEKPISEVSKSQKKSDDEDGKLLPGGDDQRKTEKVETEDSDSLKKKSNMACMRESKKKKRSKTRTPKKRDRTSEEETATESETLTDITNDSDNVTRSSEKHYTEVPCSGNTFRSQSSSQRRDVEHHSEKPGRKHEHHHHRDESQPVFHSRNARSAMQGRSDNMHSTIGQAITDHVFDGSTLISSVDSWASMFPQSPAPSRLLMDTCATSPSPSPLNRDNVPLESTPLQSTPKTQAVPDQQAASDEEYRSDGEFDEDPLLVLLRQQRNQNLHKLELIEKKLQEMNSES